MKEQGIKPGYRTQVEAAEGGNDQGDMGHASSFFLNQGKKKGRSGNICWRRSVSDDSMATPPRAEGEERRWKPHTNTKMRTGDDRNEPSRRRGEWRTKQHEESSQLKEYREMGKYGEIPGAEQANRAGGEVSEAWDGTNIEYTSRRWLKAKPHHEHSARY